MWVLEDLGEGIALTFPLFVCLQSFLLHYSWTFSMKRTNLRSHDPQ